MGNQASVMALSRDSLGLIPWVVIMGQRLERTWAFKGGFKPEKYLARGRMGEITLETPL